MSQQIAEGSYVMHAKLSGPAMLVVATDGRGTAKCEWFDKNHAFHSVLFATKYLSVVVPT